MRYTNVFKCAPCVILSVVSNANEVERSRTAPRQRSRYRILEAAQRSAFGRFNRLSHKAEYLYGSGLYDTRNLGMVPNRDYYRGLGISRRWNGDDKPPAWPAPAERQSQR